MNHQNEVIEKFTEELRRATDQTTKSLDEIAKEARELIPEIILQTASIGAVIASCKAPKETALITAYWVKRVEFRYLLNALRFTTETGVMNVDDLHQRLRQNPTWDTAPEDLKAGVLSLLDLLKEEVESDMKFVHQRDTFKTVEKQAPERQENRAQADTHKPKQSEVYLLLLLCSIPVIVVVYLILTQKTNH